MSHEVRKFWLSEVHICLNFILTTLYARKTEARVARDNSMLSSEVIHLT